MSEQAMKKKMKMMMMLGGLFLIIGLVLHISAITLEFGKFSKLQQEYWSIDKATRDAAPAGSPLANQLAEIQKFPPKLMTLKLVGVGSILTGIFLLLFAILKALTMMPMRLAAVMKGKK